MSEERLAKLRAQIASLDSISTAPAILQPLLAMMRRPVDDIPLDKVVELVSRDGAIAAQCLRVANSPLFARREVETVRSAVMTLGVERVRSVLFGLCLDGTIPSDRWVLDRNAFWRHSLGCALVTQAMAGKIGYPEPEKAYLAGLLHDIGFLVISVLDHDKFVECLRAAATRRAQLDVVEHEILGYTHGDAGCVLCEHWGFSIELIEAASRHHRLEEMPASGPLACLVHLGDLLCRVRGLSYGYNEVIAVTFSQEGAWRRLVTLYPALAEIDFFRFTLDMDSAMDQIAALVDSVFGPGRAAGAVSA